MAAVVVLPLSIITIAGAWVSWKGGLHWLDALGGVAFGLLTLDTIRRADERTSLGKGGVRDRRGEEGEGIRADDEEAVGAPYLLIKAPEHDLLLLEAESSLSEMVERTPIRGLRVASADSIGTVSRMLPEAEIVPWTAGLNEAIMDEYSRLVEMHREKIAEAMASDSSRMAAELDNEELAKKLSEALDANKKYEAVLQDLRSRPAQAQADYSKMTPSQRGEEEKRLREGLAKLQELSKAGRLEPVSIPSHFRQIGKL